MSAMACGGIWYPSRAGGAAAAGTAPFPPAYAVVQQVRLVVPSCMMQVSWARMPETAQDGCHGLPEKIHVTFADMQFL